MSDHSNKRSGSSSSSKGRSAASVRNGAKEEEEAAAVVKREQLEKEVKEALVAEWGRTMSSLLGVLHKVVRGTPHGQVAFMSADLVLDRHGKFWYGQAAVSLFVLCCVVCVCVCHTRIVLNER